MISAEIKEYKHVDILKDTAMREAVKKYSNWPTYPQLYVDGKLVGGADIMGDMHKDGTLKDVLGAHAAK
jgi:monothiol glutaredoxin